MSPEWLTAIGTLGTFVVIAASAIAALMQLRHMRGSNQIQALTECRETLESDRFQEARRFITHRLPALLQDPHMREQFEKAQTFPDELQQISFVANFFESMGAFVRFGIIDRTIACSLWCAVVVSSWDSLLPVTEMRRQTDAAIWEYFEYLAVLSKRFMEEHPTTYPRGMERMPAAGRSANLPPVKR